MSNPNQYPPNPQYRYDLYGQAYPYRPNHPPQPAQPPPPPQPQPGMEVPDRGHYTMQPPHYRSQPVPEQQWWPHAHAPSSYHMRGDVRAMSDETSYAPALYGPQSQQPLQNMSSSSTVRMPPPPPTSAYSYQVPPHSYGYNAGNAVPSRSSAQPQPPPSQPPSAVQRPSPPVFDETKYRKRAEIAFTYFDRDESGYLDFQEFQDALRHLNLDILVDDARRRFYGADLDGNQKISKREFVEMYIIQRRTQLLYHPHSQYHQPQM